MSRIKKPCKGIKFNRTDAQKIASIANVDALRDHGVSSGEAQKRIGISSASYSTWQKQLRNGELRQSNPVPEPVQKDMITDGLVEAPVKGSRSSGVADTIARVKADIDVLASLCSEVNLAEVSTTTLLVEIQRRVDAK